MAKSIIIESLYIIDRNYRKRRDSDENISYYVYLMEVTKSLIIDKVLALLITRKEII